MSASSRTLRSSIVFAATAVLAGCAGHSSVSSMTTNPAFVGSWTGTFTVTGSSDAGTSAITITPTGGLTGTVHDTPTNSDFTINGTIDSSGTVRFTATGAATGSGSGTWAITSSGALAGAVSTTTTSGNYTANYDFTKVSG